MGMKFLPYTLGDDSTPAPSPSSEKPAKNVAYIEGEGANQPDCGRGASLERCPECGARLDGHAEAPGASSCEDLFHAALALEWTDPARTYGSHHALVTTYMVQHPSRLSLEAEAEYNAALIAIVDEGLSGEQLRRRHQLRFDRGKRAWNVGPSGPRPITSRSWSATIADVFSGPIGELPGRIMEWAQAVRKDLDRDRVE